MRRAPRGCPGAPRSRPLSSAGHGRGADERFERVGNHERRIGGESGERLQFDARGFRLTRGQGGVCLYPQRLHGGEVRLEFRHFALGDPPIEQVAHAARRGERFIGHLEHPPGSEQASGLLANRRREQPLRDPATTATPCRACGSPRQSAPDAGTDRAATRRRSSRTPCSPSSWLAVRIGFGRSPA